VGLIGSLDGFNRWLSYSRSGFNRYKCDEYLHAENAHEQFAVGHSVVHHQHVSMKGDSSSISSII
jgi:hypothetical protein